LQLSGDSASPGNSQLYGTNSSGTKGWYAQPSSGAGSYPLNIVQWIPFQSSTNTTSITVTFPQATAASGNTVFIFLACDGSQTFATPAGWTVDINQQQPTYSRLVIMHKASAGDASVTFTLPSVATWAGFVMEVTGSHAIDHLTAGGQVVAQSLSMPSLTPTVGAAVFCVLAYTSGGSASDQAPGEPAMSPVWKADYIQGPGNIGGRGLLLMEYLYPATGALINPPFVNFPDWQFYTSSGQVYCTFSIL
jgi:hypothetical protein